MKASFSTTYATLRSDAREERVSRVRQIVDWLGRDFDGVIVFDESHAMQNAAGGKSLPRTGSGGERGDQAPSQQGRAGLRLQHALPGARVLYVSATGATPVHNLASAQRLGLWSGAHFPFATRAEFVEAIEAGSVAAMEVLACDLKALGLYAARSLSFEGIEYELMERQLTPEQVRIYALCERVPGHPQQPECSAAGCQRHRRDRHTQQPGQVRCTLGVRERETALLQSPHYGNEDPGADRRRRERSRAGPRRRHPGRLHRRGADGARRLVGYCNYRRSAPSSVSDRPRRHGRSPAQSRAAFRIPPSKLPAPKASPRRCVPRWADPSPTPEPAHQIPCGSPTQPSGQNRAE